MKISIITISYADGPALERAIRSVAAQQLPPGTELEHIIVCGDSPADTHPAVRLAPMTDARVCFLPPKGCYNALNEGISRSSGDIIGMLHGSDIFANDRVLDRVAEVFSSADAPDFCYGDIAYFRPDNPDKAVRTYSAKDFSPTMLLKGIAPPHPSLFITARCLKAVGGYKEDYIIGADFDLFVRLMLSSNPHMGIYLPGVSTLMSTGGLSTKPYNILVVNTREKMRALRENGFRPSLAQMLARFIYHPSRKKLSHI